MKVSVIIPTYNRERYVVRAIDSVLNQTFEDFEVIVVDDGSSDRTREVLRSYGDRIRDYHQENSGVCAARNLGIRAARGAWIAFLDSDDEWVSGYLAAQMESVRRHPEAVAHLTNSNFFFPDGAIINHFFEIGLLRRFGGEQYLCVKKPFRLVVSRSHWFLQPIMVRRDVLLETPLFDTSLTIAEDMDLIARTALKGPFVFNREALVGVYRREEETVHLSSQYMQKGIYSRKAFGRVFQDLRRLPDVGVLEHEELAKSLSTMWRTLGNLYLRTGKRIAARKKFLQAFWLYPTWKPLVKYLAAFLPQGLAIRVVRKGYSIVPGDEADAS